MDIFTHGLFASAIFSSLRSTKKILFFFLVFGALIPDVGEILIQNELSKKYGESIAVYDERTSDLLIASNLNVTFLYDILHSLLLPTTLIIVCLIVTNKNTKKYIQFFSLGIVSHIFLDSFTHGKVWALKLFFPISNNRFQIFPNLIGNWWDWKPSIHLHFFQLPIVCILIWAILILTIFFNRKLANNKFSLLKQK